MGGGGQLDGNFLSGSLPHKFIILIVTSFICLWSIIFFLSVCVSPLFSCWFCDVPRARATVPCGRLSIRAHVKIASRIVSYRVAQRKTWPDLILDLTK